VVVVVVVVVVGIKYIFLPEKPFWDFVAKAILYQTCSGDPEGPYRERHRCISHKNLPESDHITSHYIIT